MKIMEDLKILENLEEVVKNSYSPAPLIAFKLNERELSIAREKDKKIQKLLAEFLYKKFEKCFSKYSFAFMKDKNVLDAVNLAYKLKKDFKYVIKTDIKNFFDSIDHSILEKILLENLDYKVVKLIMLFFKNRKFYFNEYKKNILGIHQGDVISPVLSNIYLIRLDKFLEKHAKFVRFADDIVIFTDNPNFLRFFKLALSKFKLQINEEKTYITQKNFVFLNIRIKDNEFLLDNEKFQELISKTKTLKSIEAINNFLLSIHSYYIKVLSSKQLEILKREFINKVSKNLALKRKNNILKNKKELKEFIFKLRLEYLNINNTILIKEVYSKLEEIANKEVEKILNKSHKKEIINNFEILHINDYVSLGISKNRLTIKKLGKIIKFYPLINIKAIFIESKGVSLSSNLINHCVKINIPIYFLKQNNVYGFIYTNKDLTTTIHQAKIINTPKQIEIAKSFVNAKIKNQINYIKYLNKHHKDCNKEIEKMEKIFKNFRESFDINSFLGFEGNIATIYWKCLGKILEIDFKRIKQGANDLVNSSLNYGYAILYSIIQKSLIEANLNLHISFLHAPDSNKPSLVFDFIEEFRTYIVDRTIISMLNKKEPLKIENGMLKTSSKELIIKNIYERLYSFVTYKKEKVLMINVIKYQANSLKKSIVENKKYRGFIGRY